MKIIWFSEIKWSYLKTRKQQILSCFSDDKVYFIEPISKRIENKYTLQEHKPVYSITIPQIRSVQSRLLNRILNFSVTRKINVTKIYSFPKKEKWVSNISESFNRISGDLMNYYGYTS